MSRFLMTALSLALASTTLQAAGPSEAPGTAAASSQVGTQAFTNGLKLLKTSFESQSANGAALVPGFNAYGSTLNLSCNNAAGCFVIVNANVQLGSGAVSNPAAISIKLNGTSISAPYNTVVPTTSFTVMTYQTGIAIPLGNHTISTEVYSTVATALYRYNTEVKLYRV